MADPQHVRITLHPDGVVAPSLRAIQNSVEVASFCLTAIENGDLSKPPEYAGNFFHLKFNNSNADEKVQKSNYTNWLLSKAFQELARGIRQMLEEAYFYNNMVALASTKIPDSWDALQEKMGQYRAEADRATFPDLMKQVNGGLSSPLHFESEFLSLQKVRNCLEHRDGIVTQKDVDQDTNALRLKLPKLKLFIEQDGKEIEVGKGFQVKANTAIAFKNVVETREFKVGEKVTFKPEEFHGIGWGCWAFTNDLGSKLPKLEKAVSNKQA